MKTLVTFIIAAVQMIVELLNITASIPVIFIRTLFGKEPFGMTASGVTITTHIGGENVRIPVVVEKPGVFTPTICIDQWVGVVINTKSGVRVVVSPLAIKTPAIVDATSYIINSWGLPILDFTLMGRVKVCMALWLSVLTIVPFYAMINGLLTNAQATTEPLFRGLRHEIGDDKMEEILSVMKKHAAPLTKRLMSM